MSDHDHSSISTQESVFPGDEFDSKDDNIGRHHHGRENHHDGAGKHVHPHDHRESILRLKTAEGHLRGIQRMLEQDAYCIDILRQIQAVQAALGKVSVSILNQHLNTCVITAVRGEDPRERERVLKEIAEVFETKQKI